MKLLPQPTINDEDIIAELSRNPRLSSFPLLRDALPAILNSYQQYRVAEGNPLNGPRALALSPELVSSIQSHYNSPPKAILLLLKQIREKLSPDVCSMCGSPKPSSLDHVFPRVAYPEFSVFFKNLVPACDCNSKRGEAFVGPIGTGERVLHPYYDECLQFRLFRSNFSGDPITPIISLEICAPPETPTSAVAFHKREVIDKTTIIPWMETKWSTLIRIPDRLLVIDPKPPDRCTPADIQQAIDRAVIEFDEEYSTPNNWHSMLYSGLRENQHFVDWLSDRTNVLRVGRFSPE